MPAQTPLEKLWRRHLVQAVPDGSALLYIDRHYLYEVTSPQAFEGLERSGRRAWRAATVLAMPDHNVPTHRREQGIADPWSRAQVAALTRHCQDFGLTEIGLNDPRQGIIHVVGPEQGATLPGMTVVAGDSHTSTHGAFGALAFGIGTSEVEHVLATQCLWVSPMLTLRIRLEGCLGRGLTAKDLALGVIARLGTSGASGYAIEFAGPVVTALSMEGRMTLCNMAIEAGARVGLVGVDDTTINYLRDRPMAPHGPAWDQAVRDWRTLHSDPHAVFDRELTYRVDDWPAMVTWGTSPDMAQPVDGRVPDPAQEADPARRAAIERALLYMGLQAGQAMAQIRPDTIFIGSCTNARL